MADYSKNLPDYDPELYRDQPTLQKIDWNHPARQLDIERDALRALAAQIEHEYGLDYVRVGYTQDIAVYKGYVVFTSRDGWWWRGPYDAKACRAFLNGMLEALRAAKKSEAPAP